MGSHPKALNFTFEFRFAIEQSKQNPFGSVSSKLSVIIVVEDSMSKLCRYIIWLTFYNIDRCVCLKKTIFLSNVYTDFDDFYKFWIFLNKLYFTKHTIMPKIGWAFFFIILKYTYYENKNHLINIIDILRLQSKL